MATSIDGSMMRRLNKTAVFRTIYEGSPISRAEIASSLGMNKATASSLVDELIAEHFVMELGYGESRGGRKPMMLDLNKTSGYSIGIDVQITHITAALCDLSGTILHLHRDALYVRPDASAKERLVQQLESVIRRTMALAPPSPHGIIGVGIAFPGMVNSSTGQIHYLPNLEVHDWSVHRDLVARLQIPIFVDNDANCGALAERQQRGLKQLAFINAGIGIGVGIIANGELYRGQDGISGEFGHTTIAAMGLRCSCGSYGCWEQYASERALLRYLEEGGTCHIPPFPSANFLEECVLRADAGDPHYIRAFQTVGQHIGYGLSNVINGLNPGYVIIGGNLASAARHIMNEVENVVSYRAVSVNRNVQIVIADPSTVVSGAASLVISSMLLVDVDSLADIRSV
ncbi:MAG: ROK family protein [Alicyclobacillaceae bacterium]|nr:ROK family protein [Alicyclobacillaceae bacterium]